MEQLDLDIQLRDRIQNAQSTWHGIKTDVLNHGYVKLLNVQSPYSLHRRAEVCDIAKVARATSFANDKDRPKDLDLKLLKFLHKHKHSVPFEHIEVWLEMKLPIFLARQFVKHRTTSISEESLRYLEAHEEFYIPKPHHVRKRSPDIKQGGVLVEPTDSDSLFSRAVVYDIEASCKKSFSCYRALVDCGVAFELARTVLPLGTYTTWVYKQDLKNLLHFINLRKAEGAQLEARLYANAIVALLLDFLGGDFNILLDNFSGETK